MCALERQGFAVDVCGGPEHVDGGRCTLLATGDCPLVERADVLVHSLNLDRLEHRRVFMAIRSRRPDLPVVVEMPRPAIERHERLLTGCVTIPFPARTADLEDGIQRAMTPSTA
jgi:hypothetical protein